MPLSESESETVSAMSLTPTVQTLNFVFKLKPFIVLRFLLPLLFPLVSVSLHLPLSLLPLSLFLFFFSSPHPRTPSVDMQAGPLLVFHSSQSVCNRLKRRGRPPPCQQSGLHA